MVIGALISTLASASPPVSPPEPFGLEVDNGGLVIAIDLDDTPLPAAGDDLRGRGRVCPIGLWVEQGALEWRIDDRCHPLAYGPVQQAVAKWESTPDGRTGPDRLVAELLFVFGPEGRAREPEHTRLFVVPQAGTRYVVKDPRVATYPIDATALLFPRYPPGTPADTRRPVCEIRLEVDRDGSPDDVEVSRCDDPFVAPTLTAMRKWLFAGLGDEDLPYRVVRFRARYVRVSERARFGEVTFFEPDGIRADNAVVEEGPEPTPNDGFVPPEPVRRRVPKLGKRQRAAIEEPTVCRFVVDVDRRGRPDRVTPAECPRALVEASLDAIRKWRWAPATRDGDRVPASTTERLRFDPG